MIWMDNSVTLDPRFARRPDGRNLSKSIKVGEPEKPIIDGASMFHESRMKLYRARYHTLTASLVWEGFMDLDNELVRLEFDAAKGTHRLRTDMGPPPDFRLAISDTLRCLRSALDYLVSALARSKTLPEDSTIFPFNEKRQRVAESFSPVSGKRRRAGALYAVYGAYPDLKKIILDIIQPYSASDGAGAMGDFLWRLITMDNIDKHRLLSPVISLARIKEGHVGEPGEMSFKNVSFAGFTRPPITIRGATPETKAEFDYSTDILFPPESRLPGKPVLSSLVEGANLVGKVIKIFETVFEGKDYPPG